MISFLSKQEKKSALDGPPFRIIMEEKGKKRLRLAFYSMILIWVIHSIFRYYINDSINLVDHYIFFVLFVPGAILLLDNYLIIIGDHDDWEILKVKSLYRWFIIFTKIIASTFNIEIRVVSTESKSVSLVVVYATHTNVSIKIPNYRIKDLIHECEIININVKIRKRGKAKSIT